MERPGYFRKYIILEQLDSGFGVQREPEGFARLEGNRDGIALSLQIKYLKEVTQPYTVILIYDKNDDIGVFRVGTLQVFSRIGTFRRFFDRTTIKSLDITPDIIKYILIASEHKDRISIPLVGFCKKNVHWDEAIRKRLLGKEKTIEIKEKRQESKKVEDVPSPKISVKTEDGVTEKPTDKVDHLELEKKLKESFEQMDPFSNPRHDYSWYRVNDIAKLSNILFSCNLTIPLFANPKILVGLFKYRHLLSGFYRSDINNMDYFVLGVPAKDDTDGKPFENICRWVPVQNSEFGDMAGYWLVYINLKNGEFVS